MEDYMGVVVCVVLNVLSLIGLWALSDNEEA